MYEVVFVSDQISAKMPQKWYCFGKSGLILKLNHINIQNLILSGR